MRGKNLKGQAFERLKVLRAVGRQNGRVLWVCRCECGRETTVSSKHLLSGATKSCGCWRSDVSRSLRLSEAETFESRLKPNDATGCIEWQGARDKNGYGTLRSGGRDHKAHRLAYENANGAIPDGRLVCHSCDNPACCNPAHLFLGTSADNTRDMVTKGRSLRGSRSHNAKLTESDIPKIRALLASGISQQAIGSAFGVVQTVISRIHLRTTWSHV